MRYLLVTDGTWGDVLPFMYIALEMQKRGHNVVVLSNEHYKIFAEDNGIPFEITTTDEDRSKFLSNQDLWDPNKGMSVVATFTGLMFFKTFKVLEEKVLEHKKLNEKFDMIISHSFSYAAKTISEINRIPHCSVLISPIQLKSNYRLPVFYGGKDYNFIPQILKSIIYPMVNKFILDPLFPKEINAFRKIKGLKPIRSFVFWNTKSDLTIGLWPNWYAPLEIDQLSGSKLAGFTKDVEMLRITSDEKLDQWIKNGEKPIIVTMGSGYFFNHEILQTFKEITEISKERFIIVGPNNEDLNFSNSSKIFCANQLPFSQILPRCKLAIHHGGAGTLAQVIQAGIPHLVVPQSHDQPDNAYRIYKNNLGLIIWNQRPTPPEIIEKINLIFSSDKYTKLCAETKDKVINDTNGIIKACDLIENFNKLGHD